MARQILNDFALAAGARIRGLSAPVNTDEPVRTADVMVNAQFVGEIRTIAGSTIPTHWVACNGQVLNASDYPDAFAVLGATYGGNGTTTFAVPDLRSRVPVHVGTGSGLSTYTRGATGGAESIILDSSQMPSHTHAASLTASIAIPVKTGIGSTNTPSNTAILSRGDDPEVGASINIYGAGPPTTNLLPFNATASGTTDSAGGTTAVPTRPPYIGLNFIIALVGLVPS